MKSRIAIAILNWNGVHYLEKFLPSIIEHSTHHDISIWIIDNGSTDNSVSFVKNNFQQVNLVCLDKNYGFTGGYNKGLQKIDAEYYIILNSDIEVTPNWIFPIINEFEKNEKKLQQPQNFCHILIEILLNMLAQQEALSII